jgi:hypothetical protein
MILYSSDPETAFKLVALESLAGGGACLLGFVWPLICSCSSSLFHRRNWSSS